MDKIAIISDIHGNLEALQTVLKDIQARHIQHIYCLGDVIAKGYHQQECVDLIKQFCEVVIQGNCEEYFTKDSDLEACSDLEKERIKWNQERINAETKHYLRNLKHCHEFYLSGRLVRLFHAHPQYLDKAIGNLDTIDHLTELFLPSSYTSQQLSDISIYGHIHLPFMQKMWNRILLNPGSVGNAIDIYRNEKLDGDIGNTTVASYLILSGCLDSMNRDDPISFEFVNVKYDIEKELLFHDDHIEWEAYQKEIREGRYRDMEKILKKVRGDLKDGV